MKYYLVAGEASGDLHGSNLMREICLIDKESKFRFFGGGLMQEIEDNLAKHYREMAFMGIVNVLLNIRTIKKNLDYCKKDILEFAPNVIILIDYPGFNMKIAEYAKQQGIKVFYYISPKVWAWKTYRIKKIKAFVDEMFTIFPFETEFYAGYDYRVNYVGNPILDSIEAFKKKAKTMADFKAKNMLDNRPVVALLAGSRKQEINNTLPVMVSVSKQFPEYQYVIASVSSIDKALYQKIIGNTGIKIITDQTYDLLNNSYAALVASGTAALETALFNVPQVVLYSVEGSWFTYYLLMYVVGKIKMVSLPNIILNQEIVKEFLQHKMRVKNVLPEFSKLLNDDTYRSEIFDSYMRLSKSMGEEGGSKRAAQKMIDLLK